MKDRFLDISYMRVAAMLLVIFGHCICPYSIWEGPGYSAGFHVPVWETTIASVTQIHLPLFFLIAGFLYGYKRIGGGYSDKFQFVKDKAIRVGAPYVIVGSFMCYIQGRSAWEMMLGVSHLWFLMTIFECYVVGSFLDSALFIAERKKILAIVVSSMVIVVTVHWNIPSRFLTLERLLHYFPFYMTGMLVSSMRLENYKRYRSLLIAVFVVALVVLPLLHNLFHKGTIDQAVGLCVVIPLFYLCRTSHFSKCPSWLRSLDKYSMGIYIIHQILQQEMNKVEPFHSLMVQHEYAYPFVQFIFLVMICWLMAALAHRSKYAKYILG